MSQYYVRKLEIFEDQKLNFLITLVRTVHCTELYCIVLYTILHYLFLKNEHCHFAKLIHVFLCILYLSILMSHNIGLIFYSRNRFI